MGCLRWVRARRVLRLSFLGEVGDMRDGEIYYWAHVIERAPDGGPWRYPGYLSRPFPLTAVGRGMLLLNKWFIRDQEPCLCPPSDEVSEYFPVHDITTTGVGVGHMGCFRMVPIERMPTFWLREVYKVLNRRMSRLRGTWVIRIGLVDTERYDAVVRELERRGEVRNGRLVSKRRGWRQEKGGVV